MGGDHHQTAKLKVKMAISVGCCLKPSITPRPPPPISSTRLACSKDSTDGLRIRCMSIAAACLVISCVDAGGVVAMGLPEYAGGSPAEQKNVLWSDKIRKCPPWRVNSLENVMPENLPRPSDRRRSDGFVSDQQSAPALRFNKSCYSL